MEICCGVEALWYEGPIHFYVVCHAVSRDLTYALITTSLGAGDRVNRGREEGGKALNIGLHLCVYESVFLKFSMIAANPRLLIKKKKEI